MEIFALIEYDVNMYAKEAPYCSIEGGLHVLKPLFDQLVGLTTTGEPPQASGKSSSNTTSTASLDTPVTTTL